jgi:hypothetical protein
MDFKMPCAVFVLVILLAGCSSKKDEPAPNRYKNDAFGFSIVPPPGWSMVTADTAAEFLRVHGDRVLQATQEALRSPVDGNSTWVVAWMKMDAKESKVPILWVTHNAVGLPQVGDPELQKSRQAVRAKARRNGWRDFHEGAAQLTETDGRKSIWIEYDGTVENTFIRVSETMVPGKDRTHFISMSGEIRDWAEYSRLAGDAIYSFRSTAKR